MSHYDQVIADVGEVFFARVATDDVMKTLLMVDDEGDAMVEPGWPSDTLERSDFPRMTYLVVNDDQPGGGIADGRVQADLWVWPTGENGGRSRLIAIKRRLLQLCSRTSWVHDGDRINAAEAGRFREWPSAPGGPLRGTLDLFLGVN